VKLQDAVLSGLGCRYYTSANKVLRGSEADRKLDMFLTPTDAVPPGGEHDWSNVLLIGEHKQNPDEDDSSKTLIQLAGYAREVFGSQPDRRFVPGFTICGSLMRLWMFDRSGAYNSEKFDIHKEPEQFAKVIAGRDRWLSEGGGVLRVILDVPVQIHCQFQWQFCINWNTSNINDLVSPCFI